MEDQQREDAVEDVDEGYPPDAEDVDPIPVPRARKMRGVLQAHKPKGSRGVSRSGGNRILAQEKRRKALEFRKAGMTYADIAQQVGYADAGGARKAVIKAFDQVIQEPVAELKSIQVERLNHMLLTVWGKVQQGDEMAIGTALRIMDKIDRLMGTEAATVTEVHQTNQSAVLVIDGNEDDYTAALKRMAGMGITPDGKNVTAQSQGAGQSKYPPGMGPQQLPAPSTQSSTPVDEPVDADGIVEGEVVEDPDSLYAHLGEEGRDAVRNIMAAPTNPAPVTKKKYDFSMRPTVKRDRS